MERKKPKWWLVPIIAIPVLIICLYLGVSAFYGAFSRDLKDHRFIFGTWVNGLYATGLTVSELNEILTVGDDEGVFTIVDNHGIKSFVLFSEIGYESDYTPVLESMIKSQNPFMWFMGLPMGMSYKLNPDYSYNQELFDESLKDSPTFHYANLDEKKAVVEIKYDDAKGFYLYEDIGDTVNSLKAREDIGKAISLGSKSYTFTDEDLNKRALSPSDLKTYELWEKIKDIQDVEIIYDLGDKKIPVDSGVIARWIVGEDGRILLDEEGNIAFRDKCIEEFVDELSETCNTFGKPRNFKTTAGDVITINNSYIGTALNKKAEIEYLKEAVLANKKEVRVPEYTKYVGTGNVDSIGDTYIEIDRANQTMYYYVDGELMLSTPVVTGNVSTSHATPSMISPIVSKERDRYLIGPGYCSFVHYWMHIRNGIGIHDAMWRSEFGGDIYKWGGSHGCINTPDDAMIQLYDNVSIGTIVVIY
ncbi:MAG: L,D-transpeptidase family protein [Lachnospiraceae bacterium]|nr:L,D-transpeptidase family protein [Lachnospiraceae bacterium]